MIIQIRGTSGSGKTTVMRTVMRGLVEDDSTLDQCFISNRKKPIAYRHRGTNTLILGHYESTCGGCDNVGSAAKVYDLIQSHYNSSYNILCEGLLLSEDTKWTKSLFDTYGNGLQVYFLTTSLEDCLRRVRNRRLEAGNDKSLDPTNTTNRVAVIERARKKLVEYGVWCRRVSSFQAPSIILNLIKPTVFPRILDPEVVR